jgi:hypothetical protein
MLAVDWVNWLGSVGPIIVGVIAIWFGWRSTRLSLNESRALAVRTLEENNAAAERRERTAAQERLRSDHAMWLLDARLKVYAAFVDAALPITLGRNQDDWFEWEQGFEALLVKVARNTRRAHLDLRLVGSMNAQAEAANVVGSLEVLRQAYDDYASLLVTNQGLSELPAPGSSLYESALAAQTTWLEFHERVAGAIEDFQIAASIELQERGPETGPRPAGETVAPATEQVQPREG